MATPVNRTPVYCALIEIQPLAGCQLDPSEIAGAFVRCYIPAYDTETALKRLRIELQEMNMKFVEAEWCVDYHNTEWETPGNQTEDAYVEEARRSGDVVFDTFQTWGHDVPDVT